MSDQPGTPLSSPIMVANPYIVAFPDREGGITVHLNPAPDFQAEQFAALLADLIRHTANLFRLHPNRVKKAVLSALSHPTTDIKSWLPEERAGNVDTH